LDDLIEIQISKTGWCFKCLCFRTVFSYRGKYAVESHGGAPVETK